MVIQIRDDRQMRALTGLSQKQFEALLTEFTAVYEERRWKAYEQGVAAGKRQRKPGAGQKGKLPTPADRLLFVLYYYKTYPTFDVLGTQFGMVRSKAHENLHRLSSVLHETLVRLGVMPHREFATPEELRQALQGIDQLLIDVTERLYRRSQDDQVQRAHYSGKKNATR
jgi:hypothetical protein